MIKDDWGCCENRLKHNWSGTSKIQHKSFLFLEAGPKLFKHCCFVCNIMVSLKKKTEMHKPTVSDFSDNIATPSKNK